MVRPNMFANNLRTTLVEEARADAGLDLGRLGRRLGRSVLRSDMAWGDILRGQNSELIPNHTLHMTSCYSKVHLSRAQSSKV